MWSPIGDPPLDVTSGNVPLMTIILYMLEGTYVCTPGLFAMEGLNLLISMTNDVRYMFS